MTSEEARNHPWLRAIPRCASTDEEDQANPGGSSSNECAISETAIPTPQEDLAHAEAPVRGVALQAGTVVNIPDTVDAGSLRADERVGNASTSGSSTRKLDTALSANSPKNSPASPADHEEIASNRAAKKPKLEPASPKKEKKAGKGALVKRNKGPDTSEASTTVVLRRSRRIDSSLHK